jgi:transposase
MRVALWAEIHRLHEFERLSEREIARLLHCSRDTVKKALAQEHPPVKVPTSPVSILDSHHDVILALIAKYPRLSAVRVLEEIRKGGYRGEITLVRNYLRTIRPAPGRVYQEVEYPPGQAMQVDWGHCGVVKVGDSLRKLSVFVAVLCFSRLIYIEFTLSQAKENFYRSIVNALEFFGLSPERLIVDNLKAAVVKGYGRYAVFHPEFAALCGYFRMQPLACDRNDPESKGVVEDGVRYVKRNALQGRDEEIRTFEDYRHLAVYWRDDIANVRVHEATGERPVDRFEKERAALRPLPPIPYDTDEIRNVVVTPYARVRFEGNRYSVPPDYVRKCVIIRADERLLRVLHCGQEIATHRRSYERKRVIVDPEHQKAAFARRKRSHARQMEVDFDAIGPEARDFRERLARSTLKTFVHIRRILGFMRLYGKTEVLAALARAVEYETFDAAYVQNLIDQERRRRHFPSPLALSPKRRELVEDIELEEPDLERYDALLQEYQEEPGHGEA